MATIERPVADKLTAALERIEAGISEFDEAKVAGVGADFMRGGLDLTRKIMGNEIGALERLEAKEEKIAAREKRQDEEQAERELAERQKAAAE